MTKGDLRRAIYAAEDALKCVRKAARKTHNTKFCEPMRMMNEQLMDWLDSAIEYRENNSNWIEENSNG